MDSLGDFLECKNDDDNGTNDDGTNVYNGVWGDISTTLLIYGCIGCGLLLFFEYARGNKNVYACGRAPIELPTGLLKWLKPLIQIDHKEVLRIAGMDGFVLISLVVLFPTYASGQVQMRNSFGKTTMDHLDASSLKLWIPFVCTYLITLVVIWTVKKEWDLYVTSRLEFLKFGDPHIPDIAKFTIRVESIPEELRSETKLSAYFEEIFPNMVASSVVQLEGTSSLEDAIEEAEGVCIQLETVQANKHVNLKLWNALREQCIVEHPPQEPKVYVPKKKLEHIRNSSSGALSSKESKNHLVVDASLNQQLTSNKENKSVFIGTETTSSSSFTQSAYGGGDDANLKQFCYFQQVLAIPYYKNELEQINYQVKKLQGEVKRVPNMKYSSTGFVTFKTRQAASDALLILLNNDLDSNMLLFDATDPNNIIWKNIAHSNEDFQKRHSIITLAVKFFAIFLFIPLLAFCNVFGNIEELSKYPGLSGLGSLKPDSFLYTFITGQVPPILQSTLVGLLPTIFEAVAIKLEKMKLQSKVQQSVLDRGFGFQLVNIYSTLIGSALASTIAYIISQPTCVFQLLGGSVPAVASYFFQLILISAFLGLMMQLARPIPYLFSKYNDYKEANYGLSSIYQEKFMEQMVEFDGGSILPGFLLVAVLGLTYSVMVPFFNLISTIYFAIAFIVFKYNILFVYIPTCETGGLLFPTLQNYLLTGLNFANVTMMGYMFIKGGFAQFLFLFPTIFMVEMFKGHIDSFYSRKAESIGRKEAVALDKLQGDEMVQQTNTLSSSISNHLTLGEESRLSTIHQDQHAYRQPCLLHRSFESSFDRMNSDHGGNALSEAEFGAALNQAF